MEKKYTQIDSEELKRIQIDILDYVANYCEKNGINYWLDSGTLLGAIRHKGYIPWDDDIDIGMLRNDYNRFLREFNNENSSNYRVHSIDNDANCCVPFAKIFDTNTVLYEPNEKGYKQCVFIDLVVFDNAPDDDNKLKKMYKRRDKLQKIYNIQTLPIDDDNSLIIRLIMILRKKIYLLFPRNSLYKMTKNSRKYENVETKRVGNFTAYTKIACDKHIFDDYIYVEFEGKKYKAPIGYDDWLKAFYGDYMELPPEDKRCAHHSFIAYKEIN